MAKLGARGTLSFKVFKSHEMDWLFKRTLIAMSEKGAEIGECLYAASLVRERDADSWVAAWASLGERLLSQGKASLAAGHRISAREAFLRATTYYRNAEYLCSRKDPQAFELWDRSRKAFHAACDLYEPPIRRIDVEFEGCRLPGYFWPCDESSTPRPTLFAVGGNDDSGEESFFWNGPAAHRRGYNYFTFEYPGHRGAVHLYPGTMIKRGDQEKPFRAAFDVLEALPGVDRRIALLGYSGGGYVVTRVAAFEERVAALIASTPLVDGERAGKAFFGLVDKMPTWLLMALVSLKFGRDPALGRLFEYTLWTIGLKDISGIKAYLADASRERFSIEGLEQRISCPVLALIGGGEGKDLFDQTDEFLAAVSSKVKTKHVFTPELDGSDDHCQLDNRLRANMVMFDWLDDVFSYRGDM